MLLFDFNFGEVLKDTLSSFGTLLPGLIGAALTFLIGYVLAKVVAKIIKKILAKTKIDSLAEKLEEIDLVSKLDLKIVPSTILSKLIYYLVILIFTIAATDVLGIEAISSLITDFVNKVPKYLSAIILFIIGLVLADFVKKLIVTACRSLNIPSGSIIANFVFYFLFITITISALHQADVNTDFLSTNLTIIVGGIVLAFAIGYGLASKPVMESFLTSFFYSKGKISVGDKIKVNDIKGTVVAVDGTSITVQDDDKKVLIPMKKISEAEVEIFN